MSSSLAILRHIVTSQLDGPERDIGDDAAARVAEACRLLGVSLPTTPDSNTDIDDEAILCFDREQERRRRRPHARWLPGEPFPENEVFWDEDEQIDQLGMTEDEFHER